MITLVLFDLDGTLLNTLDDLADACNGALQAHGFPPHDTGAYRHFVGSGVGELIRRALPENSRDRDTRRMVEQDFHRRYEAHSLDKTGPYPGIMDMLAQLRERGIRRAVLSNKPHAYVPGMMERYFGGLVDYAAGKRDGVPAKPDPAAVGEILSHFGCLAEECAYVGDTDVDMQTGKRAGLYTVGVSWGFRTKNELSNQGADVIIDKPEDLTKLVIDNLNSFEYTKQ